ncbi:MAG: sterol desaturase family protein [Candidatus Berkiella sp.]
MVLNEWLQSTQGYLRIGCALSFFLLLAFWESRSPWRMIRGSLSRRWFKHISLSLISQAAIRLVFPIFLLQTAWLAEKNHQGILNKITMPFFIKVIIGILALDLLVYFQHRLMHRYKWLWFCHRVHHIDKEIDVSTGLRFHPFEELIAMAMKSFGVVFFGVPVLAALLFEIILNFGVLFTHANIYLSEKTEKYLRYFIVTPGMHRIHHSDRKDEYMTNFGFCLILWDKLFNTYKARPAAGENRLILGQEEYREEKYQSLEMMLLLPFNLRKFKPKKKHVQKLWMGWRE